MAEHVHDVAILGSEEEPTNPPVLVLKRVDDLRARLSNLRVGGVNIGDLDGHRWVDRAGPVVRHNAELRAASRAQRGDPTMIHQNVQTQDGSELLHSCLNVRNGEDRHSTLKHHECIMATVPARNLRRSSPRATSDPARGPPTATTVGPVPSPADVPPQILDRLRPICAGLPEAYEEPAWIGVRWRIRKRTFAHVYTPDPERHPLYARQPTAAGPSTVVTFRVPIDDLIGLTANGHPYFRAGWGRNVASAFLGDHTDWTEITELITDSYREMAPKFLLTQLALRPTD